MKGVEIRRRSAAPARNNARTPVEIEQWLVQYIAAETGADSSGVGADREFSSIGIDSMDAVTLAGDLGDWLGEPLDPALLWDYPTIAELAVHLASGSGGGRQAPDPGVELEPEPEPDAHGDRFTAFVNPRLAARLRGLGLDARFVRGEGCSLYDAEGRRYLDFVAGFGAVPFGHHPADLWRALEGVRDSAEPVFAQPSLLGAAGELAERLLAAAPFAKGYATFTSSGAESIEVAIKLSRAATGRVGVLSALGGFHGKTLGALSATGDRGHQTPFGVPTPEFDHVPYGDLEALERALAEKPGHYAAVVLEPVQGEGGIVEPPPGYWAGVRALARDAGAVFVADEVQTGLGRTGALWASTAEGVVPDVIALAKALGGGLVPLGACVYTADVYSRDLALKHSSTFAGNALACRAGLATLERLEADGGALLRHVATSGAELKAGLVELQARYPELVTGVRGRGYLLGLELRADHKRWPRSILGLAGSAGYLPALAAGYLLNAERVRSAPTLNASDVLRLTPPLIAESSHCDEALAALDRACAMLAARDAGGLFRSIVRRRPAAPRGLSHEPQVQEAREGDARFAFISHPLDAHSYAEFDASLETLEPDELEQVADAVRALDEPIVAGHTRVVSTTGDTAYGELIGISRTASELLTLPRAQVVDEVRAAVRLARERGARLVGLGAYTAVLTRGGRDLAREGVALTTGSAYTALSAVEALDLALDRAGRSWSATTVAMVGAAGAVGRTLTLLLAERVDRLILVGNPTRAAPTRQRRLTRIASDVCRHLLRRLRQGAQFADDTLAARLAALPDLPPADAPTAAFAALAERLTRDSARILTAGSIEGVLPLAELVVTATSAPEPLVTPGILRTGALVYDISRPRNVSESLAAERPDVLVLDGGLVEVPGRPPLGGDGLPRGLAHACMAETLLLALERRYEHAGLGGELDVDRVRETQCLAEKHGFRVAELHSFGRAVGADDWKRLGSP